MVSAQAPSSLAQPPLTPARHLPQTYDELAALPVQKKIMIATLVASGCPSAAYFARDEKGQFQLADTIELFPDSNTNFIANAGFQPNNPHNIAIMDEKGQMKGYFVLRPAEHIVKESAECTQAKLAMAKFVAQYHAPFLDKQAEQIDRSPWDKPENRLQFFKILGQMMLQTLGNNSSQVGHTKRVAELHAWALNAINALNQEHRNPIIHETQGDLLLAKALAHDIGKTEISSEYLKPWRNDLTREEREAWMNDFAHGNQNHPLLSTLLLLFYEKDALEAGLHHQSFFRYTPEELKEQMGKDGADFTILKQDIDPARISQTSKLMRVLDVFESATGNSKKPVHVILEQLLEKTHAARGASGNTLPSIDPGMLTLLVKRGVFNDYAKAHAVENGGHLVNDWPKIEAANQKIIDAYGKQVDEAQLAKQLTQEITSNDPVKSFTRDYHRSVNQAVEAVKGAMAA